VPPIGQLSLLQRGPLFEPQVLRQYLSAPEKAVLPEEAKRLEMLTGWLRSIADAQVSHKETALEQGFNQNILLGVLGYRLHPADGASAYPKAPSSLTKIMGEPDVLLGSFGRAEPEIVAVLELKKPGTNLDAPQAGHHGRSPVEQAFEYGEAIFGVRWVLVSDMRIVRLYSIDSMLEYESFDLRGCVEGTRARENFRGLYYLLGHDSLVAEGVHSPTSLLLRKSLSRQRDIKEAFYDTYYSIRRDLLFALRDASAHLLPHPDTEDLLEAVQRLLDRMLFLYYCEDSPDQLIPRETIKNLTTAARGLPGPSPHKVYDALKHLFREIDTGSPPHSGLRLNGYNGELFKEHKIIDEVDLPDSLHDKTYIVEERDGSTRLVQGVWGLHVFDFWRELNEHLLGHIFEESLSDLTEFKASTSAVTLAEKLAERKQHGIYYTDDLLSDFLVGNALRALLDDRTSGAIDSDEGDRLRHRINVLESLRIVDFACGSGAFLVSAYQAIQREYLTLQEGLLQLASAPQDLLSHEAAMTQARLLRETLYGADLLTQAVEIAKLALWLRSARKGEKIANLGANIVVQDSLDVEKLLSVLAPGAGGFDLVVGNPPWGGMISDHAYHAATTSLGLEYEPRWDSWELFLALALYALRPGGRLALVLPDTIFSPEKERSRRLLLDSTRIERLHNLGPDWFGANVRMGTVVVEAVRGTKPIAWDFTALLLTGDLRRRVLKGEVPLSQAESRLARAIPQERCEASSTAEIEIFRSRRDDDVMALMDGRSIRLADLCARFRGEEMAKSGLLWRCPSCMHETVPGKKKKGGHYYDKKCPKCGLTLTENSVEKTFLIVSTDEIDGHEVVPFIDGDDINRRYAKVEPTKWLRRDAPDWEYKSPAIYEQPKILIRQAGVGVWATYDETGSWCPQSVYLYRLRPEMANQGYSHAFVIGSLLSRTLAYYVFKRFGEVDPARAHAKLTHTRLEALPMPLIDFSDPEQRTLHDEIAIRALRLLVGDAPIGGSDDREAELMLRQLWGLSAEDGAYINGEFAGLPSSQAIADLFPDGVPGAGVYEKAA
jgi:hypothetical protein